MADTFILRPHAEETYAAELKALAANDPQALMSRASRS